MNDPARVVAVARSDAHRFFKTVEPRIRLIADQGVEGDCHAGQTVRHRSRVAKDPAQPNLRQVHLIHAELLDTLNAQGFDVWPGVIGENIATRGIALLDLPRGTLLRLGDEAVIELTGLRNPCAQLNAYQDGLMQALLERRADGGIIRKAGVMAIVRQDGWVSAGDAIVTELPIGTHAPLDPV